MLLDNPCPACAPALQRKEAKFPGLQKQDPLLCHLLEWSLNPDASQRMPLANFAGHPWFTQEPVHVLHFIQLLNKIGGILQQKKVHNAAREKLGATVDKVGTKHLVREDVSQVCQCCFAT